MRPPAEAQLLDFLFIIIIIMWSNFRGVSLQRSGSVIVGTQSYTLRLSSQNTLSLSRAGSFHGFALGLCNCKRGRYLESQKWQHLQDMQRKSDTVVMHVWFTGYQLLSGNVPWQECSVRLWARRFHRHPRGRPGGRYHWPAPRWCRCQSRKPGWEWSGSEEQCHTRIPHRWRECRTPRCLGHCRKDKVISAYPAVRVLDFFLFFSVF